MRIFKLIALCTLLALLLAPAAVYAQEQAAPEHGVIEFGFRGVTGDVYGRTDTGILRFSNGFQPDLLNSRLNLYTDNRSGFYIPRTDFQVDNLFGSKHYVRFQSASNGLAFEGGGTLNRDQSVLVTVGQYGRYKAQFRFDETPHVFSGTTRTVFASGGRGLWSLPVGVQATSYACLTGTAATSGTGTIRNCPITGAAFVTSAANSPLRTNGTISALVAGSLVSGAPGADLFTQDENRKAVTGSLSVNITPDVTALALFSREHQLGNRPIGFVMGNGSTGYAVEAPESIDYDTTNVRLATEFGRKNWDGLLGYQGSFFHNNTPSMVVESPFSAVYNNTTIGPASGRMDLYPDNNYQQFVAQGAASIGKYIHLMANVTPGFLHQNQAFQPLTTNTASVIGTGAAIATEGPGAPVPAGYPAYLPKSSLNGQVDTLAMNYTAVLKATKNLKFAAKYYHYSYTDNTPDMLLRPVIGDTAFMTSFHGGSGAWYDPLYPAASQAAAVSGDPSIYNYYIPTEYSSFTNKLFDIGGTWFFGKNKSVKFGYQRGWTDRINREVSESIEDSVYGALDMRLHKTLTLRVSGRHQNRVPQDYEFEDGDYYHRMPDQSARVRNRGDVQLSWDPTDRLSIAPFFGTVQDNFNQRGGLNSPLPLGDASVSPLLSTATVQAKPIWGPYYMYGLLTSVGRNFGVDVNYALTPKVVLFAEYAREKNTSAIVEGRGFDPTILNASGSPVCTRSGIPASRPSTIPVTYGGSITNCDPINDVLTAYKDVVNSYFAGFDITPSKKVDLSLYYSLSAGQSFNFADGVNCQIGDNGTNRNCYNSFANWKLDNLYGSGYVYQAYGTPGAGGFGSPQNVNRVHEVGAIVRFKLTNNIVPKFQYIFQQNDFNDWQTQVNPYTFTGLPYSFASPVTDPNGVSALHKMLLLGADQPSYRAHIFAATLEYHF